MGDQGKHHAVAKVVSLLQLDPILLVAANPIFIEVTDRGLALEGATHARRLPDGVRSVEAHNRVKVAAIHSLKEAIHKLDQFGGRGLLGHQAVSIPQIGRNSGLAATANAPPKVRGRRPLTAAFQPREGAGNLAPRCEAALNACDHPLYKERYERTKKRLGRQRGPKVRADRALTESSPKAIWQHAHPQPTLCSGRRP